MIPIRPALFASFLALAALAGCGGGSSGASAAPTSTAGASGPSSGTTTASSGGATSSSSGTTTSSSGTTTSSSGTTTSSSGGTTSSSSGATSSSGAASGTSAAAKLAARLGRANRLLVGLGGESDTSVVQAQGLKPDLYDQYLVGAGTSSSWPTWNSPSGAYVNVVAANADAMGAVPMFTFYQMATNGDGNLADLNDQTFMAAYWANAVLMFQRLAIYNKPALVNFEPDFWGYAQQQAPNGDPTRLFAYVNIAPDCSTLANNVTGIATCLLAIGHKYAPKAVLGFPPSDWGAGTIPAVIAFMNQIGAQNADFVVMQTLDRDAGCFEAATESDCMRAGGPWYWDETNTTHPNFQDHLAEALQYHQGLNLPLVWWQTPMGVPSTVFGSTSTNHWRDNRVHYFLTHPGELTAVGGLGVVFGSGASTQTTIATDGGQYQTLSTAYLANPAPLP
jgi:hypothetical protein